MPPPSSTHLLLIPTYNTGPKVLETVREALAAWKPVWVVTDGSDDGTTEQLEALAANEPDLRIIRHDTNRGKGAAVLTGARLARGAGFTHLLSFDADGQHGAEDAADTASRLDLVQERDALRLMVTWAYGKLHSRTFNSMDDALELDRLKLYVEHGIRA